MVYPFSSTTNARFISWDITFFGEIRPYSFKVFSTSIDNSTEWKDRVILFGSSATVYMGVGRVA
jgi:NAD-dependent SIR2 family protein deacetylase